MKEKFFLKPYFERIIFFQVSILYYSYKNCVYNFIAVLNTENEDKE